MLRRILPLAGLTLLVALGTAKLSPHEAISAQTAREMLASGDFLTPTISGQPWLEKPPLATWLIAASGLVFGRIHELAARVPSILSALALALGVSLIASKRFGPRVGVLAGMVQITTPWLILRGRLAEVDVMLAALVVSSMAAFDQMRMGSLRTRWVFFVLIGATALAKGIGFGATLIIATCLMVIVWDRDWKTFRALISPIGIVMALAISLFWPILVLRRYPQALGLWTMHVTDRLAARSRHFAGESWFEYLLTPVVQTLPWTPFALMEAWRSSRRAWQEPNGLDRLLCAWAVAPALLVSLASARNGHYLIYALPPLSIWVALSLDRLAMQRPGRWADAKIYAVFSLLAAGWAVGFWVMGPKLNSRDSELVFYQRVAQLVPASDPLVLLYELEGPDRWDREPYPTPFGPVPADLAPRLYYLDRKAIWRSGADDFRRNPPSCPFFAIARERDRAVLERFGIVEILDRGPTTRWDRSYVLFHVTKLTESARPASTGTLKASPRRAGRVPARQ